MPRMDFCPYLGKEDDPETPLLFPSDFNRCYRAEKGVQLETDYQAGTCLTRAYKGCPVFLDASRIVLISSRKAQAAKRNLRRLNLLFFSLVLLFGFCSVVLLVNLGVIRNIPELKLPVSTPLIPTPEPNSNNRNGPRGPLLKSSPTPRPGVTVNLSATPSLVTPTPQSPTPTPSKTAQPPTATPALADKVELDTRFGGEQKFVIHRVVLGESISLFAMQYSSSVDVIQLANYGLTAPLQTNILVVIPVDQPAVDPDLPAFEAYQVKVISLQAQVLAEDLDTDVDQFLYYNNLDGDQILPFGTWLIIPHPQP